MYARSVKRVTAARLARLGGLALMAAVAWSATQPAAAQTVEKAAPLAASKILPPNLRQGPDFKVREQVSNDGLINTYVVESKFGTFTAVTTAKLRQRVGEVVALRHMESIRRSDLFAKAIGGSVRSTVGAVENTVRDPIGTVSNVFSGVGKAFSRTNESLFGSAKSDAEDGAAASLLGVSEAKRKFAADFGVDVYSDNQALQERLDELARATAFGKLSYSAALSVVPGAAGAVATASGVVSTTDEIYRTTAPADLRILNRRKLQAMGVREDAVETFLENSRFTPREQTELVAALERMPGNKSRELFVRFAALTNDRDMAYFRSRQARMYAGYHAKVAPLSSFVAFGEFVAARTNAGGIVFNVPVDHMVWTQWLADAVTRIDQSASALSGVTEKRLVLVGTLTPLARKSLAAKGWQVTENAENLITPLR
ncbi:MAG: hypothetical protein AB7O63_13070 [Reyranellaceae bacterium]